MITGKTKSGFEFTVPERLDKDFRFLLAFKKCKSGDEEEAMIGAIELISAVFVKESEVERLYEHVASQHGGRIPTDVLMAEINEIIEICSKKVQSVKN